MVSKCQIGGQVEQDKTGQVTMFASFTAKPRPFVVNINLMSNNPDFQGSAMASSEEHGPNTSGESLKRGTADGESDEEEKEEKDKEYEKEKDEKKDGKEKDEKEKKEDKEEKKEEKEEKEKDEPSLGN